jgi:hypothetical protein
MFVVVAMIIGPNGSFLLDVYPDARFSKLYIFKNFRNVKKIPTVVSIQKSRSELFNDFCLFCTQSRKVTKLLSFTRRTVDHRKRKI